MLFSGITTNRLILGTIVFSHCKVLRSLPLRLDYCGFGPFCSTGTKLLLSIIKRQIIRLSNDMNNIKMDERHSSLQRNIFDICEKN